MLRAIPTRSASSGCDAHATAPGTGGNPVQVLVKALHLLDLVSRKKGSSSLGELVSQGGLPRSTTYRILQTLVTCAYLEVMPDMGYVPGRRALHFGALSMASGLVAQARDLAAELRDRTQLTVYIATLHDFDLVYLQKFSAPITTRTEVGTMVPANCSGLGRTILAHLPQDELDELLRDRVLEARSESSITDIQHLIEELESIRSRGYALGWPELTPGVESVAAPIFNYSGECVAAVNVALIRAVTTSRAEDYVEDVAQVARNISRRMGYLG